MAIFNKIFSNYQSDYRLFKLKWTFKIFCILQYGCVNIVLQCSVARIAPSSLNNGRQTSGHARNQALQAFHRDLVPLLDQG